MRLYSIDILRALTMFFMIWVNDFWTLNDVPKWLLHAKVNEDYLGFSDIIFPLFLFIVGLSIPFAIKSRFDKGHSFVEIGKHIIIRSFSLLLIGLFMVNYETAYNLGIPIGKYFWGILMALAIFLIWTDWKKSPVSRKWQFPLQILGFLVLFFLAMIYEGGGSGEYWMRPQWWGILGLIGWAYLVNAFIFLLSRGNGTVIVSFWLLFYVLSVWNQTDAAFELQGIFRYFSTIVQGTIPAFTASGMIASLVLIKWSGASLKKGYVIGSFGDNKPGICHSYPSFMGHLQIASYSIMGGHLFRTGLSGFCNFPLPRGSKGDYPLGKIHSPGGNGNINLLYVAIFYLPYKKSKYVQIATFL